MPYSILYNTVDQQGIFKVGPFATEQDADNYVRDNSYPPEYDPDTDQDYEFYLNEQNVYLLRPDHSMSEYTYKSSIWTAPSGRDKMAEGKVDPRDIAKLITENPDVPPEQD